MRHGSVERAGYPVEHRLNVFSWSVEVAVLHADGPVPYAFGPRQDLGWVACL